MKIKRKQTLLRTARIVLTRYDTRNRDRYLSPIAPNIIAYFVSKRVPSDEVSVGRVDDCPVGLDRHLSVRGLGSDGSNRIWKGSIRILVVVKGWNGDRRVGKGLVFIIIW